MRVKTWKVIEFFTANDGIVLSTRVRMTQGEMNRSIVKLAPLLYSFQDQNGAADIDATRTNRQQEKIFKHWKTQNLKITITETPLQVETKNLFTPQILRTETLITQSS